MGATPYLNQKILGAVFGSIKALYFGYTMDDMIEPSKGTGYKRVAMESDTFFEYTSSPSESAYTSILPIQFPKATGNQGVIRFVAVWNKPTGGDMLFWWKISPTKVSSNNRLVVPTGLTITLSEKDEDDNSLARFILS